MSMSTAIIRVKFVEVGIHCWPSAPKHRAYLRNPHRHRFFVTVETEVYHDDREIEFHDLLDDAKKLFHVKLGWSCEHMARHLAAALGVKYRRRIVVIVSEDGECESEVSLNSAMAQVVCAREVAASKALKRKRRPGGRRRRKA